MGRKIDEIMDIIDPWPPMMAEHIKNKRLPPASAGIEVDVSQYENAVAMEIGRGNKLGANLLEAIRRELQPPEVVTKCGYCGQWAAIKTACWRCGAPVDPPEMELQEPPPATLKVKQDSALASLVNFDPSLGGVPPSYYGPPLREQRQYPFAEGKTKEALNWRIGFEPDDYVSELLYDPLNFVSDWRPTAYALAFIIGVAILLWIVL